MGPLKICMLVFNDVTSDPRVTKEARDLCNYWDVTVIGINTNLERPSIEKVEGYSIFRASSPKRRKGRKDIVGKIMRIISKISGIVKITRLALSQNPNVYHAHDFEMLPIAFFASRIKKCKCIYDSHELWIEQRADFPKWFKWCVKRIEGFFTRRIDKVITVNESIAVELKQRYRLAEIPTILHNFTHLVTEKSEVLQVPLVKEEVIVLYHGGYIKDRGLNELIQAVGFLPNYIRVHLRGIGPLESELKAIASDYIEQGKVKFCEPVPLSQLVKSAGEADIGIIPYQPTCLNNYYSLPNKLSEYAMAGLAICASNLPEIAKLNEQIRFGNLFDPYSPQSIADAIVATCEDLPKYRANAKRWAQTLGNWEKESVKLIECYKELFGES
jgi:glycosyltransferase involved in cell wall biosynthesis